MTHLALTVPDLGTDNIRFGLWLVELGERVHDSERLAELLIPGASVDMMAPAAGRLVTRLTQPFQPLRPGQIVGELLLDTES